MRIIVVQETDWLKRGPHQQHHLFERLSLRGHDVTVLDYPILREHWPRESLWTPRVNNVAAARIYDNARINLFTPGTISFPPLARPSSVLSHYVNLERLIQQAMPDVIVSYALSTGLPALRLARKYAIPYVFHVIDALHAIVPSRLVQPIARQVERWIFSASDEVILINKHLHEYAIQLGANPQHARVLRSGVDLDRIKPTSRDNPERIQTRESLGFGAEDVVLFFMGWLYDFSGLRDVVAALEASPAHVRLLVVGDGDEYDALTRFRDSRGLQNRLVLTGRVPYGQIPALLTAADVCLLPFHTVPATEHIVPIKLYEYMASGWPVISTPLPGVVGDIGQENGVIFATPDQQVSTALSILPDAVALGQRARSFVERHCGWQSITDVFESLLLAHVNQ